MNCICCSSDIDKLIKMLSRCAYSLVYVVELCYIASVVCNINQKLWDYIDCVFHKGLVRCLVCCVNGESGHGFCVL